MEGVRRRRSSNDEPAAARLPRARQVELLETLLRARAELDVLGEGLLRELEHPGGRVASGIVGGEDGEDVAGGDARAGDGRGEEDALAKGGVGVYVDPLVALVVGACGCGAGEGG